MYASFQFELAGIRRIDDAEPGEADLLVDFRTIDRVVRVQVTIPIDRARYREEHYLAVARHELAELLARLADRSKGYRLTDLELAMARA